MAELRMVRADGAKAYNGINTGIHQAARTVNPTMQQFRSNVTQLLSVESNTQRERTRSHEALVHAGKMAAVGRMVASINHEIKRPLASMHLLIENTIDLIARGDQKPAMENLDMVLRATDQLAELSRQLEGFSRKTPLNRMAVPVLSAVKQALCVLSPKIKAGRHELRMQVGAHHVDADLDRLTLALVNLIDNAMDAGADAPVRHIDIDARDEAGEVVIRIRDYGPGIAAEAMDKLFEAFFTTKPPGQGLGLGLTLSNEVICEMGGRLEACNVDGGGAEFSVRLPRAGV